MDTVGIFPIPIVDTLVLPHSYSAYSVWASFSGTSQEHTCSEELRSSCKPSVGSSQRPCSVVGCFVEAGACSIALCFVVLSTDPGVSHRLGKC